MKLLLTRPHGASRELAAILRERGIATVISPVISIVQLPPGPAPDAGLQAVLLTSANAVPGLRSLAIDRRLAVHCAGDATRQRAVDAGYLNVSSAAGDAAGLAERVRRDLAPGAGRLLWLRGAVAGDELTVRLAAAGYRIEDRVVYRADPVRRLTREATDALAAGEIDGVLHFSARSARLFSALLGRTGLAGAARRMTACCMSDGVAEAARGLEWRSIRVADRPTLTALLATLPDRRHIAG